MIQHKWFWKMNYCRRNGLPPAQEWAWSIAENAYNLEFNHMKLKDIIPTDIKPGEIVTRKIVDGKVVEETREQSNWQPNAADLDRVNVTCECGNTFDVPWDVTMFLYDTYCGQCGKKGQFKVINKS